MSDFSMHPLEAVLTFCAEAAPSPWYPSTFVQTSGVPREKLDPHLDALRLGGLIRLTDWVQGHGQGYALTPEGEQTVKSPRLLEKLRAHGVPKKPAPPALAPARATSATTWDRGEKIRAALLSPPRPIVSLILILANIVVFLVGLMLAVREHVPVNEFLYRGDSEILYQTGAVNARQILDGQWWRLLTSCFVHVGLLHLAVNMFALYREGPLVEALFGHWRFLLLYVIAGFGGSCVGVLFQLACAGASGALCGILAAFAAWTWLNRAHLPPPLVTAWLRNVLINAVLIAFVSGIPGISWSGHLGGAVVGLIAASLLNLQHLHGGVKGWLALVAACLLPLFCYSMLVRAPEFMGPWALLQENKEWNERIVPAFNDEILPVWNAKAVKEAVRVLRTPVGQRDKAQVREILDVLGNGIKQLAETAAVLREVGPGKSERVETARLLLMELTDALIDEFELFRQLLKKNAIWTDEIDNKLEPTQKRISAFFLRWVAIQKKP
jgi:membrane associated rhomboid family serine protease